MDDFKWIPCSERLPEKDVHVLVTYLEYWDRKPMADAVAYLSGGTWLLSFDCSEVVVEIIAWMPLPEPYNPE